MVDVHVDAVRVRHTVRIHHVSRRGSVTVTHQNYINLHIFVTFLVSDKWWHKLISLFFFFSKHDYFGFLKLEPDWAGFLCFNSSFCLLYRSVAKSSCTPPIEIWPNHHNNVPFLPQTPFKNDWGDREPGALTQTHPAFTHNAVQHKPQTK